MSRMYYERLRSLAGGGVASELAGKGVWRILTMVTPEKRIERTIQALCDELFWGLRYFYAAKVLDQTKFPLTPTLFGTFYWACLDQACLILSRMVIAKEKLKDEAINVQYLFHQAGNNPSLFRFAEPGEVEQQVESHRKLLETYQPVISILEDQRDRNLAHLDRKHIKQPEWRENQPMLDLSRVEELYHDLRGVISTYYYKLFFDSEFNFGDWYFTSQSEVKTLIDYFEALQLVKRESLSSLS
jgi:hypothetical protein